MIVGVGTVPLAGGSGADFLAWLGTFATPILAGVLGWAAHWRRPLLTAVAAGVLYLVAWQAGGGLAGGAGPGPNGGGLPPLPPVRGAVHPPPRSPRRPRA